MKREWLLLPALLIGAPIPHSDLEEAVRLPPNLGEARANLEAARHSIE